MNEDQRGEGRCGRVAEAGYQPDEGMEAHAVLRARNREEIIQDVSKETGKLVSPIGGGRKHLHFDFSSVLFHQAIDRMVAPAFKRLCCFPASEVPAKEYCGEKDTRRPVGRRQGWLFSAKFLARKGRLRRDTFEHDASSAEQSDSGELEGPLQGWGRPQWTCIDGTAYPPRGCSSTARPKEPPAS